MLSLSPATVVAFPFGLLSFSLVSGVLCALAQEEGTVSFPPDDASSSRSGVELTE